MDPTVPHQAQGQANDFPGDSFLHSVQYQPHNHALQNAWVSFRHQGILSFTHTHSSMCIPLQVPPAPANGQPEDHWEDIPPPVRNVARPQDPHHFHVAYQGAVDHHPQPLVGVSSSRLSAGEPPFDRRHSGNRTLHMYSPTWGSPKASRHKHDPTLRWVPIHASQIHP